MYAEISRRRAGVFTLATIITYFSEKYLNFFVILYDFQKKSVKKTRRMPPKIFTGSKSAQSYCKNVRNPI